MDYLGSTYDEWRFQQSGQGRDPHISIGQLGVRD